MTQNNTKIKKKFKFMAYHYEAIELRYQGKKYEEVAKKLSENYDKNFLNNRIRHWFKRGGILEQSYVDYAKKENDRRRQVVLEELKKITGEIPTGYANLINALKNDLSNTKSAAVFRQTLKDLSELLGFRVEGNVGEGDPLDDYFDRQDKEWEKNNDESKPEVK